MVLKTPPQLIYDDTTVPPHRSQLVNVLKMWIKQVGLFINFFSCIIIILITNCN